MTRHLNWDATPNYGNSFNLIRLFILLYRIGGLQEHCQPQTVIFVVAICQRTLREHCLVKIALYS